MHRSPNKVMYVFLCRNLRLPAEPRTVVLHRAKKGFGFILRGAKATSPLMELTPSEKCPGLQYLDDVDTGGVADMAGLRKGDFLLEINDEDVSTASHEHVVDLIRRSGDLVSMTVVSLNASLTVNFTGLPSSKSTAALPGALQPPPQSRLCATLPRKLPNGQSSGPPLPPRRDPKTTLSVGRARAKSMVAGLENGGEQSTELDQNSCTTTPGKSNSAESIHRSDGSSCTGTPTQPRTASIRARPTSSRITAAELEELFQRQQDVDMMTTSHFQSLQPSGPASSSSPAKSVGSKVYASVAEMKRGSKSGKASMRVRFLGELQRQTELHRDFHSTPNLACSPPLLQSNHRSHHSHEDMNYIVGRSPLHPPPSHPPPPPPVGQLIMVNTSRASKSEYDIVACRGAAAMTTATVTLGNVSLDQSSNDSVMSSFRPADSAKLYASPEDMKTVGYRSRSLPSHSTRPHVRKSHSLRTSAQQMVSPTTNHGGTIPCRSNGNPYAQPINLRTKRTQLGVSVGGDCTRRRSQLTVSNSSNSLAQPPPPIPEPDYSLSESSAGESDDERHTSHKHVVRVHVTHQPPQQQLQQPAETSGSSSGSGSASSSMQHSFSVNEIQKIRTQLKSSKSYPNDFLMKQIDVISESNAVSGVDDEDCDNSSSGVSSDQEPQIPQHKHLKAIVGGNVLSRNAVSLAQLPPPAEHVAEESAIVLPPPPEFEAAVAHATTETGVVVLAPPPQFSDHSRNRNTNKVRIVGTVPKNSSVSKQGRLHSQ